MENPMLYTTTKLKEILGTAEVKESITDSLTFTFTR